MSHRLYAGIDIGATNIKFGLIDAQGKVCLKNKTATPEPNPPQRLFERVLQCGEQLLVAADEEGAEVAYLGVGSPGTVNLKTGVVEGTCPNLPGWAGFPLGEKLRERLNLPVFVDNDANCAAWAEYKFGAGYGSSTLVCLTIGTGIGGGLILDGRLYRGRDFAAGEIGQMKILNKNGEAVESVVLETQVSSRAILAKVTAGLKDRSSGVFETLINGDLDRLTIRKVFAAFKQGDELAREVLEQTAHMLGLALGGVVSLLNPEVVIIGGGVTEGGVEFVELVRRAVRRESFPIAVKNLSILPAALGNDAGFIGAAFLEETV